MHKILLAIVLAVLVGSLHAQERVTDYVDPMIGSYGWGNVGVGPSCPLGMAKPSPDCTDGHGPGWQEMPERVDGFAQMHVGGTGGGAKYGNILITPFSGTLDAVQHLDYRKSEDVKLGYYACEFEGSGIRTEISAAEKTSIYRFTYPSDGARCLSVDAGFFLGVYTPNYLAGNETQKLVGSEIQIISDTEIIGYSRVRGGWNCGKAYTVFFYMVADQPFTKARTWKDGVISDNLFQYDSGKGTGALVSFAEDMDVLNVKVGISHLGCMKAKANVLAEMDHWSLEKTRSQLVDKWEAILSKVELDPATPEYLKRMFYTGLYHTYQFPVDKTGENPYWNDGEPYFDDYYALWDTYRTSLPMMTLLTPDITVDFVRSLISTYKNDRYMPDGRSGNENGRTQGGSNADIVIADAYLKGLEGIDWEEALQACLKNADVPPGDNEEAEGRGGLREYNELGYIPYGIDRAGNRTVEYSYCDYAIYQLAKGLGKTDLAERFFRQSSNWKNLWRSDYEYDGVKGFILPKDAQGNWLDEVYGLSPDHQKFTYTPVTNEAWKYSSNWQAFFYEGTSWQYSLAIPHDVPGLIEMCGGPEVFRNRLDTFFDHGYYDVTNQPSFIIPCLYHWLGRPDLTGERITGILAKHFNDGHEGLPGNDDSGSMSCWMNFHLMGLYPFAGQDLYLIHTPVIPSTVLHLEDGDFTIRAEGLSEKNRYIVSASLNGIDYPYSALRHRDIVSGGDLVLKMGSKPGIWGREMLPPPRDFAARYEDADIPVCSLPDPMVFNNGKKVRDSRQWTEKRRDEILEVFSHEMYGHIPVKPEGLHFETIKEETVYDGLGIRKTVRIYLDIRNEHWFDVLIHLPKDAAGPVPVFTGLNFKGNDATLDERADFRWPYELILKSGMGVATAWRDAIEPDGKDSWIKDEDVCRDGGIRSWYNPGGDWGAISAWAWGLSRIMDYLETDKAVDSEKVAVIGHSRLGKTALWAGANDTRFAMVVSNDSGCCGAALSRRVYGENFAIIANAFPHWFTPRFKKYMWNEAAFPADQHWLLALTAPRPLYIASATEDQWADPEGEWFSAYLTSPVYALFGMRGLDGTMPAPDSPDRNNRVGYHMRTGSHNILAYDWRQYIAFAQKHLK